MANWIQRFLNAIAAHKANAAAHHTKYTNAEAQAQAAALIAIHAALATVHQDAPAIAAAIAAAEVAAHTTPAAHHAKTTKASEITSETFHLNRIPTPLTGKDADSVDGKEPGSTSGKLAILDANARVQDSAKLEGSSKATVQNHNPKAHTLASHSTKAHTELTGVTANQHHTKYTDAEVSAIIAAKFKAGNVTDTTGADGKVSVAFAEAFGSTPIVIVQLENDVDYYPVITAKNAAGFTVKILKTAHLHAQGNTGAEAAHTHGISFASGAGSSHRHSNPSTSYVSAGTPSGSISSKSAGTPSGTIGGEAAHTHGISFTSGAGSAHKHSVPNTNAVSAGTPSGSISSVSAGTPSGTIGAEAAHTHGISITSGAGSAHSHTNPNTNGPSATTNRWLVSLVIDRFCAETSGGPTTKVFWASQSVMPYDVPTSTHTHTQGNTGSESAHTHSVSGTSGAGSSHTHSFSGSALGTHGHTFTGSALGTHSHTIADTGNESTHTHSVSGTSGAGSSHNHAFTGSALATHNHTFTGSALSTHRHTQGSTGYESAHTHTVSGTSGAGGGHSHTNPDTSTVNAGNALVTTAVTFSYIAMIP